MVRPHARVAGSRWAALAAGLVLARGARAEEGQPELRAWLRLEAGWSRLQAWTEIEGSQAGDEQTWGHGPQVGFSMGSGGATWSSGVVVGWSFADNLGSEVGPRSGEIDVLAAGLHFGWQTPVAWLLEVDLMFAEGTLSEVRGRKPRDSDVEFSPRLRLGYPLPLSPAVDLVALAGAQWFHAADDEWAITATHHLIVSLALALEFGSDFGDEPPRAPTAPGR